MVNRDTYHDHSGQDYEEESITSQTVKKHLIVLIMKIANSLYSPDRSLGFPNYIEKFMQMSEQTQKQELSKVNLNTGQRDVSLWCYKEAAEKVNLFFANKLSSLKILGWK